MPETQCPKARAFRRLQRRILPVRPIPACQGRRVGLLVRAFRCGSSLPARVSPAEAPREPPPSRCRRLAAERRGSDGRRGSLGNAAARDQRVRVPKQHGSRWFARKSVSALPHAPRSINWRPQGQKAKLSWLLTRCGPFPQWRASAGHVEQLGREPRTANLGLGCGDRLAGCKDQRRRSGRTP